MVEGWKDCVAARFIGPSLAPSLSMIRIIDTNTMNVCKFIVKNSEDRIPIGMHNIDGYCVFPNL